MILDSQGKQPAKLPMICSLPPAELRERRAEIQTFLQQATQVAPLSGGVEMEFPATSEIAHALIDFMLFERVCCSSLTYELCSQPDRASLTLRLTGPAKQVEALRSLFLPAL